MNTGQRTACTKAPSVAALPSITPSHCTRGGQGLAGPTFAMGAGLVTAANLELTQCSAVHHGTISLRENRSRSCVYSADLAQCDFLIGFVRSGGAPTPLPRRSCTATTALREFDDAGPRDHVLTCAPLPFPRPDRPTKKRPQHRQTHRLRSQQRQRVQRA